MVGICSPFDEHDRTDELRQSKETICHRNVKRLSKDRRSGGLAKPSDSKDDKANRISRIRYTNIYTNVTHWRHFRKSTVYIMNFTNESIEFAVLVLGRWRLDSA